MHPRARQALGRKRRCFGWPQYVIVPCRLPLSPPSSHLLGASGVSLLRQLRELYVAGKGHYALCFLMARIVRRDFFDKNPPRGRLAIFRKCYKCYSNPKSASVGLHNLLRRAALPSSRPTKIDYCHNVGRLIPPFTLS